MPSVTTLLNAGATIENILEDITRGYNLDISDRVECKFECDCSKERMEEALLSIGKDEIKKILEEDHGAEVCCHFCNKKYKFTEEEKTKIEEAKNKFDEVVKTRVVADIETAQKDLEAVENQMIAADTTGKGLTLAQKQQIINNSRIDITPEIKEKIAQKKEAERRLIENIEKIINN